MTPLVITSCDADDVLHKDVNVIAFESQPQKEIKYSGGTFEEQVDALRVSIALRESPDNFYQAIKNCKSSVTNKKDYCDDLVRKAKQTIAHYDSERYRVSTDELIGNLKKIINETNK